MSQEASPPTSGRIVVEWAVGHDPGDYDTYAWKVTCEPTVADDLVVGVLSEVLKVY